MAGPQRLRALHRLEVVTASERVAEKARQLGYTRDVIMATGPDDLALIEWLTPPLDAGPLPPFADAARASHLELIPSPASAGE